MDSDCEAQGYPRNFYITSPLFHSHLLTITNQIGQIQSGTSGGCVKAVQCRRRVLPASEEYSYIITSRAPPTCTPPACGAGAWCRPSCSRGTPGDSPAPGPGWAAPRHPPPALGTAPHTRCRSSCLDMCGLDTCDIRKYRPVIAPPNVWMIRKDIIYILIFFISHLTNSTIEFHSCPFL